MVQRASSRSWPPQLVIGLILVAVFWAASWLHLGVLGEYSFFPLWLGYILTVDGLVAVRRGDSLLNAHPRHFAALFVLSAPIWWLFEGLNNFTLNWHYLIDRDYSVAQIILLATLNFSTVIPAVFETTQLWRTFGITDRLKFNVRRTSKGASHVRDSSPGLSRGTLWLLMYVGAGMFFLIAFLPTLAFPLIWVWLFLLVDALNALRGRPSLLQQMAAGDWRGPGALALAALTCGFFWELWNFYAMPKWYYTVPYLNVWHVFEMPLPGYLGYIPFAWELYALYQYVFGLLRIKTLDVV